MYIWGDNSKGNGSLDPEINKDVYSPTLVMRDAKGFSGGENVFYAVDDSGNLYG